jgi:hypothetical protein
MFRPKTPLRLHGCNGKTRKDSDGQRRRVVVLTFQAQPFTDAMANDLNVKGRLFSINDGTPLSDVASIALRISVPGQKMSLFEAPDDEMPPSVVVDVVQVSPILNVRADKEGPVYSGLFSAEFPYPEAKHLLWLFHRVTEQVFATFEPAGQQELPVGDEAEDEEEVEEMKA